jgi:antitoxin component of MazEF toxin-antitoxin module
MVSDKEMTPLKRRVCRVGNGLAVFLPKTWIELLEEKYGKIDAVSMEVNGKLTIRPIIKEAQGNH